MKLVAFTNDGKNTIHVGPKSVRPGETREVDSSMIPEKHKNKAHGLETLKEKPKKPEINPILTILDGNVGNILMAISEKNEDGLYKYSPDDLSALEQAEQAGNTRKGVIEGLTEERLTRANAVQEMDDFVKELTEMPDEDLTAALELHAENPELMAVLQVEADKRKAS